MMPRVVIKGVSVCLQSPSRILHGDCLEMLKTLSRNSVHTCVTSPPYFGLRDYGVDGQIGLESTVDEYVERIVAVFREVRRVLRDDGTLWLNLGDSYSTGGRGGSGKQDANRGSINLGACKVPGYGQKQLLGIPWRIAFALQSDGWILRQDIIWHKRNPMPESIRDRCTKAHEYIFLLAKSPRYHFDSRAIREPSLFPGSVHIHRIGNKASSVAGDPLHATKPQHSIVTGDFRNKRSVWTVSAKPFKGAHFATFPPDLIEPCVLAGAPLGGVVLDPFLGSGTTAMVAAKLSRRYIGIELNGEYVKLARERIRSARPIINGTAA